MALFALVILGFLDLLRSRVLSRLGTWLDHRLSAGAFSEAIRVSLRSRLSHTRPIRDLQELRNFMSSPTLLSILDAPWMPIYAIAAWAIHPALGMLAIGAAVVFLLLALLNEVVTRRPLEDTQEYQAKAQSDAESIMRNAEVINALGMGGNIVGRWMVNYHTMLGLNQVATDRARSVMVVARTCRMAVQVGVMGLGAFLVLRHEMGSGGMIAGSILVGRTLAPVEGAIETWKQATAARRAFERLRAFFADGAADPAATSQTRLPAPQGLLSVRDLVFAYPNSKAPTIRGVSFDVSPGEVVALVGRRVPASRRSPAC
jgi:ABC-type protease/lipase transport system fused ATPase/permease subunit